MRRALAFAAAVPLAFTSQAPDTLTPDGPATIFDDWHGGQTDEGLEPVLLTAFRVTVQPGGRAGTVRFLLRRGIIHASAPVTLPAEPGTYTFPAPHVLHDYREVSVGIEQETGGHAIAGQITCRPEEGEGDWCADQSLDVYRPPLAPGTTPDRRLAEVHRGGRLTIERVTERDSDGDLVGDETEDRTNLRTTITHKALSGRRREYAITIENAGPRVADRPQLGLLFFPSIGAGRFTPPCAKRPAVYERANTAESESQFCPQAPLAVGERRTLSFVIADQGSTTARATVRAEGTDLVPGDEYADAELTLKRPPLQLRVEPRPNPGSIVAEVHTRRAGPVTLRLQSGGRTFATSTLRFRRAGGRRVVLKVTTEAARGQLVGRTATVTARSRTASARVEIQPSY